MTTRGTLWFAAAVVASSAALAAQTPPMTPKPFPQPGQTSPPPASGGRTGTPPATTTPAPVNPAGPAPAAAQTPSASGAPTAATLNGAQVYPGAEYLESHDAGRGQRVYLFGTNAAFLEIVQYYRQMRKDNGRELFKAPAMQQWDLGDFREQTMAAQPSIVVKDYSWNGSEGFLFVDGSKTVRYKTIIQIVPAAAPIK